MPATVIPDVIFSSKVSYSTTAGGACERIFRVDGLTPSPNIGFDAIAAVQGFQPNGAQLQQQHPTAANYFVVGYDVRPGGDANSPSQTSCFVVAQYVTNQATGNFVTVEILGSHGTETLNRWTYGDQKGNPILVGFMENNLGFSAQISPEERAVREATPFFALFNTIETQVESHNTIVRYMRREVGSPLENVQKYRQFVNSVPWYGYAIGTVLCRDIMGRNLTSGSIIAPGMYDVTYELEISGYPWGWQRLQFFKDSHTGKPLTNVTVDGKNNGYTLLYPYPFVDFSPLKLPDPRKGSGAPPTF